MSRTRLPSARRPRVALPRHREPVLTDAVPTALSVTKAVRESGPLEVKVLRFDKDKVTIIYK